MGRIPASPTVVAGIRRRPQGSGTFTNAEIARGFRSLGMRKKPAKTTPVTFPGVPNAKR